VQLTKWVRGSWVDPVYEKSQESHGGEPERSEGKG